MLYATLFGTQIWSLKNYRSDGFTDYLFKFGLNFNFQRIKFNFITSKSHKLSKYQFQNRFGKNYMIKKKLEPLKKPTNFNEANSQHIVVECLSELIKQQKRTNEMILRHLGAQNKDQITFPYPLKVSTNRLDRDDSNTASRIVSHDQTKNHQSIGPGNFEENIVEPSHLIAQTSNDLATLSQKVIETQLIKKLDQSQDPKKNYNVLNELLPYTDRRQYKILVDFERVAKQFPIFITLEVLQKITVNWIGDVFRVVASMCWNMMLNGFLTFEESKILFTQNIIYNYIQFMNELQRRQFGQHKHRLTSLINKKSINILEFLGKQYPQTKIDAPNIRLKQIIPNTNNATRMKFDVITIANRKVGLELKYRQSGNYSVQIMSLINFIIQQTNENYNQYEKECLHLFNQIFMPSEKRANPKDGNNFLRQKPVEKSETAEDIFYRQKVKKFTKFLIGRKINKNVPKYTRQQINNGVFFPKSPSILRVITKWVQQLTEIIRMPQKYIMSADRELKSHDGNFVVLFSSVRAAVCKRINETRDEFFKKIQLIRQECFYIESILSSSKYTKDSTQSHLSQDQISVGKFSVCLQKAISSYIFQELNEILHYLLKIPLQVDQKNVGVTQDFYQSEIRKQLDRVNLITMKIFDLLRCKCISNQEEIIWIMKYLIERNQVQQFKLIRVKDRLSQGTRDINCNIRFSKGSFLTEMQLSVTSTMEAKQQKLDSYNHFLYQLKRSKLGPISENVSIWTVLQQRSLYFQKISRNAVPLKPQFHSCSNQNLEKYIRPICCQSCNNFYPFPETIYANVRCKMCKKTYCGECYSVLLSDVDKRTMIFDGLFKQAVLNHIVEHKDPLKPFPFQGVYFKRYHERRELNYFTVLILDPKTNKPITYQNSSSNGKEVQCSIIFTHNAIRNGKTIQKQKNTDKTINAILKNQNQLYIDKKDYAFFSQYLIFYFDKKFQSSIKTLDEIQDFLRNQQNRKLKVLNITEDPVYVDDIQYLRKKSEKVRELFKLRTVFQSNLAQRFLVYQFKNIFILAKAHKSPQELGNAINYARNIAQLKFFAVQQKSIISLQKCKIRDEFINLSIQIGPKLLQSLNKNLRKMYLNYNLLENLEGLKTFQWLQILYLRHNALTSLSGIQKMKDLIVLRFDDNKVQNLQPLQSLSGLKRLMGNDNRVKSLEPLRNLKQLRTIQLDKNQIQNLEPIKDLHNLEQLNFKNNTNLATLPAFSSIKLKTISLSNTNIKDLDSLVNYKNVQKLMLEGMGLKQIPKLIKSMKLTELWLGHNQITQVSNVQGQEQLQILSLKDNKIKFLSNIEQMQVIKIIYMDSNQLTSLNGIKHSYDTLKYLSLKQNPLDDLKELIYADETFHLEYSKECLTENAKKFLEELYNNKINSSGSQD